MKRRVAKKVTARAWREGADYRLTTRRAACAKALRALRRVIRHIRCADVRVVDA